MNLHAIAFESIQEHLHHPVKLEARNGSEARYQVEQIANLTVPPAP